MNTEFESIVDKSELLRDLRKSVSKLLELRQDVDPSSKAYTFLTYSIDNANRAIEVLK